MELPGDVVSGRLNDVRFEPGADVGRSRTLLDFPVEAEVRPLEPEVIGSRDRLFLPRQLWAEKDRGEFKRIGGRAPDSELHQPTMGRQL
jgi:hypothetical protein